MARRFCGAGTLVTGENVSIITTERIANFGGVIDGGNGRTMLVAGRNIVNHTLVEVETHTFSCEKPR